MKKQKGKQMEKSYKKFIIVGIVVLVVILGISLSQLFTSESNPNVLSEPVGEKFPIVEGKHLEEGTAIIYNSNPPTSGDHWPQPAPLRVYDFKVPDEVLVHNLEHGAIWISYNDVNETTLKELENIAQTFPEGVIMTPRPENDHKISLASWGYLDKFDVFDKNRIISFIQTNINRSPEPFASLDTSSVRLEGDFPEFQVTEADGKIITKNSLLGTPSIVWFTTSWCTPCKIGAQEVAKLDKELGDDAFKVLVIFVDLKEKATDMTDWREKYANEDWAVAFDNESTKLGDRINLRYLDSKYLLDRNGIIKNIDFEIADKEYLDIIRDVINEDVT